MLTDGMSQFDIGLRLSSGPFDFYRMEFMLSHFASVVLRPWLSVRP